MQTVSFKVQENILEKINKLLRPLHFNNRTEFIREAIREKINTIENDVFMQELVKFKGAAKTKVSDKRLHELREEIARKFAKKFDIKLD
jgi:metal-responsive CopG/Arc/MetJ family transcriptional regulator